MNAIIERLRNGGQELWEILPAFIGAGLIFIAGYLLARTIERLIDRTLGRLDFNRMAEAGGLREAVDRTGARLDPTHAVGKLFFWLVMLIVTLLASAALGLESINEMFSIMIAFLPTLVAAIVMIVLGMILGEFLRGLILASAGSLTGVPAVAAVAKLAVVVIAIFMALDHVGVTQELVVAGFTLVLGAVALAFGLAFGLGNTALAGEIVRRWYEEQRAARERREMAERLEWEREMAAERESESPAP